MFDGNASAFYTIEIVTANESRLAVINLLLLLLYSLNCSSLLIIGYFRNSEFCIHNIRKKNFVIF